MKLIADEMNAADVLIDHLCEQIDRYAKDGNPLRDRYVGFCAVTAAAHIETLVKDKVLDFCHGQNVYLYAVFGKEFRNFNGRIGYQELRTLLARFDDVSESRFVNIVQRLIRFRVRASAPTSDLIAAYKSLLSIRHSFSHNINAAFPQVSSSDMRLYVTAAKRVACAFLRSVPSWKDRSESRVKTS